MSTASRVYWQAPTSAATSDITYVIEGRFSDDNNGERLNLFMTPTVIKEKKKPGKWLQKVIKYRGRK